MLAKELHLSLDDKTPDEVYFDKLPVLPIAAKAINTDVAFQT
jgi:hypothetical protein